jgi:predicted DNA-binding transcriptional regulator AlpA
MEKTVSEIIVDRPGDILAAKELCLLLGISRVTLWRRVKDGKIKPPRKFGSAAFWVKDDVRELVESAK